MFRNYFPTVLNQFGVSASTLSTILLKLRIEPVCNTPQRNWFVRHEITFHFCHKRRTKHTCTITTGNNCIRFCLCQTFSFGIVFRMNSNQRRKHQNHVCILSRTWAADFGATMITVRSYGSAYLLPRYWNHVNKKSVAPFSSAALQRQPQPCVVYRASGSKPDLQKESLLHKSPP